MSKVEDEVCKNPGLVPYPHHRGETYERYLLVVWWKTDLAKRLQQGRGFWRGGGDSFLPVMQ